MNENMKTTQSQFTYYFNKLNIHNKKLSILPEI